MAKRVSLFDIARFLCILEIVSFWHLFDYVQPTQIKHHFFLLTNSVLVCFSFLSGLFLSKKNLSFKEFYLSRFLRFYPLFFLSSVTFYLTSKSMSTMQLFHTLTGLGCFCLPAPKTLWYFSMLVFFYLITPFLLMNLNWNDSSTKSKTILMRSAIIYIILLAINYISPIDNRLLLNYPFYILGFFIPIDFFPTKKISFHLTLIISTGILLFITKEIPLYIYNIIFSFGVFLSIISISALIDILLNEKIKKLFTLGAYSSMCAYLFHRQIYGAFVKVFGEDGIVPYYALPLMCIILFITSYFIQKSYDFLRKKLFC